MKLKNAQICASQFAKAIFPLYHIYLRTRIDIELVNIRTYVRSKDCMIAAILAYQLVCTYNIQKQCFLLSCPW